MVKVRKGVMKRGGNGCLFCSALKIWQWFNLLAKTAQSPDDRSGDCNEESSREKKQVKKLVFDLGTISLHYTREAGNYQQKNAAHEVHYMNMAERRFIYGGRSRVGPM